MKYNTSAGFTLIEVLVVIVILGLLLMLGVPAILSTRNSALAGISAEEENSIKEAEPSSKGETKGIYTFFS